MKTSPTQTTFRVLEEHRNVAVRMPRWKLQQPDFFAIEVKRHFSIEGDDR
jgi:hypothetical protein